MFCFLQIRIRDPNQGGKDITEEIMSGGGSRNPTPPTVRPTSTPTPPQVTVRGVTCPHLSAPACPAIEPLWCVCSRWFRSRRHPERRPKKSRVASLCPFRPQAFAAGAPHSAETFSSALTHTACAVDSLGGGGTSRRRTLGAQPQICALSSLQNWGRL